MRNKLFFSVILNVHNEGEEVKKTIHSMRQHISNSDAEFIVVDDASTDGSCNGLGEEIRVIRNEERIGVTRGRNQGANAANGNIILHTDGHARLFDKGTSIEAAARLALKKRAIVVPAVGDFTDAEGRGCKKDRWYRSEIDIDDRNLLKIKRIAKATRKPYQVVNGPSNGFYITPKEVFFNKLGMFSPYTGRFGWAEIGTAIRAWFTNVQIISIPDLVVAHKFRSKFPYEVSTNRDLLVNMCQTHLICFDDETFQTVWEPRLKKACQNYESSESLIFSDSALRNHEEFISKYKIKTDAMFFDRFRTFLKHK